MDNKEPKTQHSKSRAWISLVILLICLFPVVGAWVLLEMMEEGWEFETTNYGQLVTPARPLKDAALKTLGGDTLTVSELKGKWTLVIFGPAECGEVCRRNLYETRQVRLATGQDVWRVQRLWVTDDLSAVRNTAWLERRHPDLIVASEGKGNGEFVEQFALPQAPRPLAAQRVYIVDPLGNIVISYPPEETPKHILEDLERLLYVSHIG